MVDELPDQLRLGAVALAEAVRKRKLSAVELVSASLDWIAGLNDRLKAFITICDERALVQARRVDEAAARGAPLAPLHGLPVAIKDLTATAGIGTTFGSSIYESNVPDADELVVARLREAGAVVVGKTNTPEFGFGARCTNALCGPTANPFDASRTSGGSSGGSAVAVATGMVPLAHGTDFGGSVRTPASFCGVVGLRPTPGVIPSVPKAMLWDSLSVHGILARSVDDAALMLEVMSGGDARDPVSLLAPPWRAKAPNEHGNIAPRLALSADLGIARIDPAVRAGFDRAAQAMSSLASEVAEAAPDCAGAQACFETLRAANLFRQFGAFCQTHADRISPGLRWNVERGRDVTISDFLKAEAERGRLYLSFLDFFERYDILATVSASVPPFSNTQEDVLEIAGVPTRNIIDYLTVTYTISLVGFPAMSIPGAWTDDGLPVGIQLVAPPFEEARLFAFARRLQDELGFRHRWPMP